MNQQPIKHAPEFGKLIEGEESRDAVHIACAPVVASQRLAPGQAIEVDEHGNARIGGKPVGIVDPFLKQIIEPEQKFWLMLYPNTITTLRHYWEHPAFSETRGADEKAEARLRITALAISVGGEFGNFDSLMEHVESCVNGGEHYVQYNGQNMRDAWDGGQEQFWKDRETLTGKKKPEKYTAVFCCTC
jgi:hypothetical protein